MAEEEYEIEEGNAMNAKTDIFTHETNDDIPEGFKIQKIVGVFDIYDPHNAFIATRPTLEDAIKHAICEKNYYIALAEDKRRDEKWMDGKNGKT